MIEILIAILLQITTIVGGTPTDKASETQKAQTEATKANTDQTNSAADGGNGTWNDEG